MDEALAHWLQVREAADRAARSTVLTDLIVAMLPVGEPVRVLDLATGAGSNVRYLMERLPARQHWLLVDHSALLLAALLTRTAAWALAQGYEVALQGATCTIRGSHLDCVIVTEQRDLGALDDGRLFAGRHLVTASALLDLVSESWLQSLARQCRAVRAAALFTINYNGQQTCVPVEPEDALVRRLMNTHQERDKGLGGPAEGPAAHAGAERCFADEGYAVRSAASDWNLGTEAAELQRLLLEGWAGAAVEADPAFAAAIADWHARRIRHVDEGTSRIVVGHHDLAAWPVG